MTSNGNHRLTFLLNLNQELNESGEPLKLSVNNLDQAIIEACSSWSSDKPLMHYLLPCWKRAVKAASANKQTSGPKFDLSEESKRLCMSNCLFAVTMPVLYGLVAHDSEAIPEYFSFLILFPPAASQTQTMILLPLIF
jgi:ubiquitin conjugation factor E4 B